MYRSNRQEMCSTFGAAVMGMARDKNALRRSFLSMVDEDDASETTVYRNGIHMSPVDDTAPTLIRVEKMKSEDLWDETTSCGGDTVSEFSQSTKSSAWNSQFELPQKSSLQFSTTGCAFLHDRSSEGSVPAKCTLSESSNRSIYTPSAANISSKDHAAQDEIHSMFERMQHADSGFMHAEKFQKTGAQTPPPSNRVDVQTEHVSMAFPAQAKKDLKQSCANRQHAARRLFQHSSPAASVPQVMQVAQVPQMPVKETSTYPPVHPLIIRPPPGLSLSMQGLSTPPPGLSQAPPGLTLPPPGLSLQPQSTPCDEAAGMLGHPELCTRPCIFFSQGLCGNGNSCGFCHLPHSPLNGTSNKSVREPHLDKRGRTLVKTMKAQDRAALIIPILEKKAIDNGFQAEAHELLATLETKMQPNPNLHLDSKLVNLTRSLECLSFRSLLPMLLREENTDTPKDTEIVKLIEKLRKSIGVSLVKKLSPVI